MKERKLIPLKEYLEKHNISSKEEIQPEIEKRQNELLEEQLKQPMWRGFPKDPNKKYGWHFVEKKKRPKNKRRAKYFSKLATNRNN